MSGGTWIAILLAALLGGAAQAQDTVPEGATTSPNTVMTSPILTIVQDRIFTGTRFGQAVQARFEAETRALQAENRKIEADLEAEERGLTDLRATLPPEEFRVLADAFDTKVEGIRDAQDAKARALGQKREQDRQKFFETAIPVLAAMMEEMGAEAIIDKSLVILAFDRIDVTDRAIARIDAELGEGPALP